MFLLFIFIFGSAPSLALDVPGDTYQDSKLPITHCFHWLEEKRSRNGYLTYKYRHAENNGGELTFIKSHGRVGYGLYCAKNPYQSRDYGDRLIRIDFALDVVFKDYRGRQWCRVGMNAFEDSRECQSKSWDVHHFDDDNDFYILSSEASVFSWSANSDELLADLSEASERTGLSFREVVSEMNSERNKTGPKVFFNLRARSVISASWKDSLEKLNLLPAFVVMEQVYKLQDLDPATANAFLDHSLERILKDDSVSYKEVESVFRRQVSLRDLLRKKMKAMFIAGKSGDIRNWKVPVQFLNRFADEFSEDDPTIDIILENLALDPETLILAAFGEIGLSSQLMARFSKLLNDRVLKSEEFLDKLDADQLTAILSFLPAEDSDLSDVRSRVQSLFIAKVLGRADKSPLFTLGDRQNKFSMFGNANEVMSLCNVHLNSGQLSGEIGIYFRKWRVKNLGVNPTDCEGYVNQLNLIAQLTIFSDKNFVFARGQIDGKKFEFAVTSPKQLEEQFNGFMRANFWGVRRFDQLIISVNGDRQKTLVSPKSSPWDKDELYLKLESSLGGYGNFPRWRQKSKPVGPDHFGR